MLTKTPRLRTNAATINPTTSPGAEQSSDPNREQLLNEKEVAAYLGLAPKTIRAWRTVSAIKLPFSKLNGRAVRYRRSDLEAFVLRGLRNSTSDEGTQS